MFFNIQCNHIFCFYIIKRFKDLSFRICIFQWIVRYVTIGIVDLWIFKNLPNTFVARSHREEHGILGIEPPHIPIVVPRHHVGQPRIIVILMTRELALFV